MNGISMTSLVLFAVFCMGDAGEDRESEGVPRTGGVVERKATAAADAGMDLLGGGWLGPAISYSGYREGQSPNTDVRPTTEQIREDLRILARHWDLIRVYGSGQYSEEILELICQEKLDLKVMLGAWLAKEPGHEDVNRSQVGNLIRLANEYSDTVVAVNVGNEILVGWTAHPVPEEKVVAYVRQVKRAVSVPVTVADNYAWWRDHGAKLAMEVDFLTIHTYPVWERKDIDEALAYTIENYESVKRALPGKAIVIGEAGWPTYTEGNLHVPRAGDEIEQKRYLKELTAWAKTEGVTVFVFEAFDEPWKGTGTEGHWGLFSVDRKAKLCMQATYPDLMPDGPTSPSYAESQGSAGPEAVVAFRDALAPKIGKGSVNAHGPGVPIESVTEDADAVEGGSSLRFWHNGSDWGGIYILLGPIDASAHKKLVLSLKVPDSVTSLEVKIEGPPTMADSIDLIQHVTTRQADGWRTVAVPLAKLPNVDLTKVAIIGFWNPKASSGAYVAAEIRVDDIHFE